MVNRHSPEFRNNLGQTAYKRKLAFERLGIDPKDVECVPFFRADLRRIARHVNRGRPKNDADRPFDYLGLSEDPDARTVMNVYLLVPESYRKLLPAEAFCHAAGVPPERVLELIAGVAVRLGALGSSVIAAAMHPQVVRKTIERALHDNGTKERMMLLRAAGFLPRVG
jgi:hypothetical protein